MALDEYGGHDDAKRIRDAVSEIRALRKWKQRRTKASRLLRAWVLAMMDKMEVALGVRPPRPPVI